MKSLFVGIVVSFCVIYCVPVWVAAAPIEATPLSYKLQEKLPRNSRWGLSVVELHNGAEKVSLGNADVRLMPASLMKLFVAGAVLEMEAAGRHLPLKTDILYDGQLAGATLNGNIYLRGNGNCLLTSDDLQKAAQFFKAKGLVTVTGKVIADASRFDTLGLERSRRGAGYAPAGALGLALHTVSVVVEPGSSGKPPMVMIDPPNEKVRFAVAARTTSSGSRSISVKQIDDGSYNISGDIPEGSAPAKFRFSLVDPAGYAAGCFHTLLRKAGISVVGDVAYGITPGRASILLSLPGPSLHNIITEMNKNSLNVVADNLLLALGGVSDDYPATREKGVKIVKQHLARNDITEGEAVVADGSGLLPANRISPKSITSYLAATARQPWFGELRDSLPRPGLDGTLKNSTFRNESFHVKTGSLENVTALAGYGMDREGREFAFAFIVESPTALAPAIQMIWENVLGYLAE